MYLGSTLDQALGKGGCCNGHDVNEDPPQTPLSLYTIVDDCLRYSALKYNTTYKHR